ncbi:MAG: 50S ribosomal protein L24 [Candidatus Lokiarchaeota archaeon]|nr:50S ribosomal protein L24 [Candidatus Lokiarchaeota archaeon]
MTTTSRKPRKQRNWLRDMPLHRRGSQFNAKLEKSLSEQYDVKRLPIRVNDHVRVTAGQFKELEGKVLGIDRKAYKITVEEITKEKADGSLHYYPIHPSKVIITKLVDVDKRRQQIIERRKIAAREAETDRRLAEESKAAGKKRGK